MLCNRRSSIIKKLKTLMVAMSGVAIVAGSPTNGVAEPQSATNAWSIGIAIGPSPLQLKERRAPSNPILTHRDIQTPPTEFVADPFLVQEGDRWLIFFELFNATSKRGEIGVAESSDLKTWRFLKVILAEPFHLSYPYVLKEGGEYYMIPESKQGKAIRLYRATNFPLEWEFDRVLVEGEFVDPSLVFFNGRWWLFAGHNGYSMSLFFADSLKGPWTKHPQSPIYRENPGVARPAGRPVVVDGTLIRFVQDNTEGYGKKVQGMIIDEISPTTFREHASPSPLVFKAHGDHWARNGMHHVSPVRVSDKDWIAAIDGSGDSAPERR